jgi:cyanophycin synthetase
VVLAGADENPITELNAICCPTPDRRSQVTPAILAAVGAGWALGIPADVIRAGIESFDYSEAGA